MEVRFDQTGFYPVCLECGAVVQHLDAHTAWHTRLDDAMRYVRGELAEHATALRRVMPAWRRLAGMGPG